MIPIRDSMPSRSVPVVTRAIILINALVFFYELALPEKSLENLFYVFGIVPARFTDSGWANAAGFPAGGWWVFLTYQVAEPAPSAPPRMAPARRTTAVPAQACRCHY
jgi:membrane associated rhomboid family serine protease